MNILFVSTACSNQFLQILYEIGKLKPMYSIQKFHKLLMLGFIANGASVDTITSIPCSRRHYTKYFFFKKSEKEDEIYYHYSPCINLKLIKNVCDFIYSFIYTFLWCIKHRNGVIIFDVLNVSISIGALLASKIFGNHTSGIVTDMPGYMVSSDNDNNSKKFNLSTRINKIYLTWFDCYVLLTKQMNEIINIYNRPYIVMEGLVDNNIEFTNSDFHKRDIRKIIYAGALYERYGVKMLVEAFDAIRCDFDNVQLHLYGYGPMSQYLDKMSITNPQIFYHGVVPNSKVVEAESEAILLINPRPTNEDFTKYSFPSKNMEYMVSGTPVLTTKLPGMPPEYYPYVYLFDQETVEGYKAKLSEILSLPDECLVEKGRLAQKFVKECKNNVMQSKRILDLYSNL